MYDSIYIKFNKKNYSMVMSSELVTLLGIMIEDDSERTGEGFWGIHNSYGLNLHGNPNVLNS